MIDDAHDRRARRSRPDRRRTSRATIHGRRLAALALVAGLLGAGFVVAALLRTHSAIKPAQTISLRAPAGTPVVRIGAERRVAPVPAGFLGLSIEYTALLPYAGKHGLDPVFLQLIRNLSPGAPPLLRIGGDSSDFSWVPVAGQAKPPGVKYVITPEWLNAVGALVHALHAHAMFGLNLDADSTVDAAAEARAFVKAVGESSISALEIGNEPELYSSVPWYSRPNGSPVFSRPPSYSIENYASEFGRYAKALPKIPLAGPATGSATWLGRLSGLLGSDPRLRVVTAHLYPLSHCYAVTNPEYPTLSHLMSQASSIGLARSVAPAVKLAHSRGLQLRVDEMNSASCRGQRGLSNTYATALWVLDALFAMASVNVNGVSIHTLPSSVYHPFALVRTDNRWHWTVDPLYYGLLMFADAAPSGSRLLSVSGSVAPGVPTWAVRTPGGQTRIVLINKYSGRQVFVKLQIPRARAAAALTWLRAPSLTATRGITLGGQSFGSATTSGLLAGTAKLVDVAAVKGAYVLRLPAASAAMLTVPATGGR